eukprot:TRINITY_DN1340_c0_g2_i3.p3 TRINITY_DN1340_c0_g2~~TRINITY_DN1340_c0_g2_i3.p3  ORF type:complete len:128 (-),score=15.73 TRINITY_DN1340_c0_g2_i3:902-1285(-)
MKVEIPKGPANMTGGRAEIPKETVNVRRTTALVRTGIRIKEEIGTETEGGMETMRRGEKRAGRKAWTGTVREGAVPMVEPVVGTVENQAMNEEPGVMIAATTVATLEAQDKGLTMVTGRGTSSGVHD